MLKKSKYPNRLTVRAVHIFKQRIEKYFAMENNFVEVNLKPNLLN